MTVPCGLSHADRGASTKTFQVSVSIHTLLSASGCGESGCVCCSELEAAQSELSEAKTAQLAAEAAATEAERAMGERQKRFQHVHAKLKRDEDALKARVERFEAEAAGYGEQIGAALSQADAAIQVGARLKPGRSISFWHASCRSTSSASLPTCMVARPSDSSIGRAK